MVEDDEFEYEGFKISPFEIVDLKWKALYRTVSITEVLNHSVEYHQWNTLEKYLLAHELFGLHLYTNALSMRNKQDELEWIIQEADMISHV